MPTVPPARHPIGSFVAASTAVGMVKKAVETFGRLDVAVNCAGVMDDNTAIADMSDEMLEKTFRINTFGLMYGLREECKQ